MRGSLFLELRRQSSDKQGVFFFFFLNLRKTEKGKSQNTRETSLLVKRTDVLQSASLPLKNKIKMRHFPSIAGFFLNGISSYLLYTLLPTLLNHS